MSLIAVVVNQGIEGIDVSIMESSVSCISDSIQDCSSEACMSLDAMSVEESHVSGVLRDSVLEDVNSGSHLDMNDEGMSSLDSSYSSSDYLTTNSLLSETPHSSVLSLEDSVSPCSIGGDDIMSTCFDDYFLPPSGEVDESMVLVSNPYRSMEEAIAIRHGVPQVYQWLLPPLSCYVESDSTVWISDESEEVL